jgi:hypothetical protein
MTTDLNTGFAELTRDYAQRRQIESIPPAPNPPPSTAPPAVSPDPCQPVRGRCPRRPPSLAPLREERPDLDYRANPSAFPYAAP